MVRENRLFLGNPGSGKSTLINCLIGTAKLKSGLSWGGGLTQDYQRVDHDGVAYMDTPGLADMSIAEQAAAAITKALKQGGTYKLFFMMRLQNGRVVSEDLVTMERVLGALDVASDKIHFSVIFNNVDKKQLGSLTQADSDAFAAVHRVVNGRQFKTGALCFIPVIDALDEASDAVAILPQHVRDFMDASAPSMKIEPGDVRPVNPTGFEQQARVIQEEMDQLLKSKTAMMTAMATQQQQNDEALRQERATRAAQLQSVQRDTPLSPGHDYAALFQTPLTMPSCGGSEPIVVRKKTFLAVVGVAVGVVVLVIIIIVATTRGNKAKAEVPPPSTLPPTNSFIVSPAEPSPSTRKGELMGCEDEFKPRYGTVSIESINGTQTTCHAADVALQKNMTYFAISANRFNAVAFNQPVPKPTQFNQVCNASAIGSRSWTVYMVVNSSTISPGATTVAPNVTTPTPNASTTPPVATPPSVPTRK